MTDPFCEDNNNDLDMMGDSCDADMDDDGLLNEADNCPQTVNADQLDEDSDASPSASSSPSGEAAST